MTFSEIGVAMSHTCARRGCDERIPRVFLMCPACWALVPDAIKRDVQKAWGFEHPNHTAAARRVEYRRAIESVPPKEKS